MSHISKQIHTSFLQTAFLFAVNHGASLSCLGLANSRLGNTVGSYSSSALYFCYTGFALLGAPLVVKELGSRKSLMLGMAMASLYVASFWAVAVFCSLERNAIQDFDDGLNSKDGSMPLDTNNQDSICSETIATMGGAIGGFGSAILWTAQGSYFSQICNQYAREYGTEGMQVDKVTGLLGGEWAFVFLFVEVWMRILSTLLLNMLGPGDITDNGVDGSSASRIDLEWRIVFTIYTLLAAGAVVCMIWAEIDTDCDNSEAKEIETLDDGTSLVKTDPSDEEVHQSSTLLRGEEDCVEIESSPLVKEYQQFTSHDTENREANISMSKSPFRKAAAALDLLVHDPKMKWLSFVNITFGLCTAFTMSVVNGEVIRVALNDDSSSYVGTFTAITSLVAAVLSLAFGKWEWQSPAQYPLVQDATGSSVTIRARQSYIVGALNSLKHCGALSKESVLCIGAVSYFFIAVLFVLFPTFSSWTMPSLLLIYVLLGIGRSTYEGTLRAIYADYFCKDTEGAYSNIILFNGAASMVGYWSNIVSSDCSISLPNDDDSRQENDNPYCVQFKDGSTHNIFLIEMIIVVSAILAVAGIYRSKVLFMQQKL